jgi:hypothetical protein
MDQGTEADEVQVSVGADGEGHGWLLAVAGNVDRCGHSVKWPDQLGIMRATAAARMDYP